MSVKILQNFESLSPIPSVLHQVVSNFSSFLYISLEINLSLFLLQNNFCIPWYTKYSLLVLFNYISTSPTVFLIFRLGHLQVTFFFFFFG